MSAGTEKLTEPLAEDPLERAVLGKVTLRLIPFLCLLYFVNILDRANIAFARLQMLDIMSERAYALGAGIFSLGYCLLQVPSNLVLRRLGARRWIACILVSWGLISAAMMFLSGPWSFSLLRFLLGCAEAGFFPGVVLYLTWWFPARQRARAVALLMTAAPLTWIVGGPLSGALLQYFDRLAGLAGWQWLFLLEGLPAVLLGFITLWYLTDRPAEASWLTAEERSWLAARLGGEEQQHEQHLGSNPRRIATDPRVWHLVALAATIALGISGLGYYLPELIRDRFPDFQPVQIGSMTAISGTCTFFGVIVVGWHSDRTGERRWHVAGPAFLAAAGWGLSIYDETPWVSFLGMVLAQAAMLSMWGPFWSLGTASLSGRSAAGGIAFINAVGNLGAFLGPNIIGWLKESTGHFAPGLAVVGLVLVLCGILALAVRPGTGAVPQTG